MSFSGGLKLTSLDDHINPSQNCIIPTEKLQVKGESKVTIQFDDQPVEPVYEKVSISLTDCLACSGCITSAETILVQMQSHEEVYKNIASKSTQNKTICASLSPQIISSFSAKFNLSYENTRVLLCGFLKSIGVDYVFDVNIARDIMLLESAKEVMNQSNLPVLSSSCPGWICYAEKTHEFLLPSISKVKSPQQIMGSLIKDYYAEKIGLKNDNIYHFTIMPCYDKKLEASRTDFYNDLYQTRDVDCVITAGELEKMLIDHHHIDLNSIQPNEFDSIIHSDEIQYIINNEETMKWLNYNIDSTKFSFSSNYADGLLEYVFYSAARIQFNFNTNVPNWLNPHPNNEPNIELPNFKVNTVRNQDFKEVCLIDDNNETKIKFASAYGFRNIQNVVRKLKNNRIKSQYQFIEVMACPSGCIHGGGQLKNESVELKQWLKSMKISHFESKNRNQNNVNNELMDPYFNPFLHYIYSSWLKCNINDINGNIEKFLFTQYHGVKKVDNENIGLITKW